MNMFFNFSIMPLRLASILGFTMGFIGLIGLLCVLAEYFMFGVRSPGWASLMATVAIFSGAQLVMLGLIGEYVGRAYMTLSGKPQSLVRKVDVHVPPSVA
jgi:undecaprenyl-phosphate 4-deoxy-4-formamido-L-arabinose transferase